MAYVSTEADARLIAAAPELLRVLVSLLEHGNSAPGPLWGEASAAIAKATGEPS